MPKVDIGIATFKRPDLLERCLRSVASLHLPEGCMVRVIVADNDVGESARERVEELRSFLPFDTEYVVERRRGISHVRNTLLEKAESPLFAFIDDDEVVEEGWLSAMVDAISRYEADVVFGPVHAVLPANAPSWAYSHPSFRKSFPSSGQRVRSGGTGNVMLRTRIIDEGRFSFDPSYALTGGGDTDFFNRLHKANHKMVWCAEAVVKEEVPEERLSIGWVMRRAYRGGQCFVRVYQGDRHPYFLMYRMVVRLALIVTFSLVIAPLALVSRSYAVRGMTKAAGWMGQVAAIVFPGVRYEEYSAANYRPGQGQE